MAKINLLPWREELREQRKKQFVYICIAVVLLAILSVLAAWFFLNHKLQDQEQANQLIVSTNQSLDVQLKSLEGLQERRNAVIERMKLIQGLEGQRPVTVRLVDELVRVVPETVYLTKFTRTGNKFTIEGKAESPNAVAELLRGLEASQWYRNAFMNSFLAAPEVKEKAPSSVIPRVEESYGTFIVTVDLGAIAQPTSEMDANNVGGAP
ncbi:MULTISPECIES: PilN domain-containing protein [unclassified Acinetobacter]|uniref:PilN domain-containing protein n=1 Tax=unclassified Acinetobacter TaxID=196816 RepID=UPI0004462604|nr:MULTISPECIES: PilN domain-containing protein [unclassified Acinetobacter]EZQ12344.1 membrane protein [Acinetobacter sp. Ver3]